MKTKIFNLIGKRGIVPIVAPDNINLPKNIYSFDNCCGPGKGIAEIAIPDKILGLKISAACFVHDYMWKNSQKSWVDFHHSNSVFLNNILSIVTNETKYSFIRFIRCNMAITYYIAVNCEIGKVIFWKIHRGVENE